jgi:2,3-bisphosphoglycerate-independent phosphoglycerate mutase
MNAAQRKRPFRLERHRALLIICDGMGDRPERIWRFQTPLSSANKPNMDTLAKNGSVGLMDPVAPGVRPGSDVAHLAILGYDPYKFYTGRGALEAAGAGFKIDPGDIAFRCNFATVDDSMIVKDRRAGRATQGREELAEALRKIRLSDTRISFEFAPTVEHRGVLILRGEGLSRRVSDTDPNAEGLPIRKSLPEDEDQRSRHTAEILNEFTAKSYDVLRSHPANTERVKNGLPPANIILSRGPGTLPPIERLTTKYSIDTACIAVVPIVRGVCRAAGMTLIEVKGATGGLDSDFKAKASAAVEAMKENDFVFLHIKATDVASHNGNFGQKVQAIERIDEGIGIVAKSIDLTRDYVVITSDHTTPVTVKDHSADAVPILIAGPDFDASEVKGFCERKAATGNLGRIRALHLMPILMDRLGRMEKFGF